MKVKVYENRHLEITQELGTQNENNIEEMELEVPEKYQDWVKEIVFITDNGTVWDLIENDTYIFKKNITKYEKIKFYIRLVKDGDDFRSIEEDLYFNENHEIEGEVTPEEQSDIERAMATIESGLARVTEKEDELVDLIDDVQTKLDNGEFDGKDGIDGRDGIDGADGVGLEYSWDNTSLGIKREDEDNFTYVDLKGDKGDCNFATFDVNENMELVMNKTADMLLDFSLDEENMMLEVLVNE